MPTPTRKGIFIVLLAMCLVVAVAVIPDIISEEMRAWCLKTFGEGYQGYLLGFFVVGSVVLLFLTTDIGNWLRPGATAFKPDRFNIPPGVATRQLLNQAKTAISQAEPGQALRLLSDFKITTLDAEIDLLSSRLVEYQRSKRHGVDAPDEENRTFNRITRDIRDLVSSLEKELAEGVANYQTIREYLKKRYTNRLGQKLAKRQPVNLRRIPSTEGTSDDRAAAFIPYSSDEVAGTMAQAFRDARGRLLLIGAPGAGKTTLMLQLVLDLLDSEPDALPVLLNLATWTSEYITIETWLKKILPAELGVSEKYAQETIEQGHLILLLDGFDEIRKSDRADCLEAIGRYGENAGRQFVISSRIGAYKSVAKDAPVHWQIEVGPLSIEQLEIELNRLWEQENQPEARALLQAIQKDTLLRESAETPFYFNTLQILFGGGKTLSDLHFTANNLEGRQTEILERFIEYELKAPVRQEYPPEKIKHWLSFLASRMTQRNMVVFDLKDLQYDWWNWNRWQLGMAILVSMLVRVLVLGLVFGLIFGLAGGQGGGLVVGLGIVLVLELVFGLVDRLDRNLRIKTIERANWSLSDLIKSITVNLVFGLVFGLAYGLVVWLVGGLVSGLGGRLVGGLVGGLVFGLFVGLFSGLAGGLVFGLIIGLIVGLIIGLGVGLIVGLGGVLGGVLGVGLGIGLSGVLDQIQISSTNIIQISTPYYRFNASMKAFHFSILQHKLLCYQMRKQGLLPPDLPAFLNELSLRHILEFDGDPRTGKGGGAWRFRHRILQEWFAERWGEPEENKSKTK